MMITTTMMMMMLEFTKCRLCLGVEFDQYLTKELKFSLRILPCDCEVRGHCMCKEMLVIPVGQGGGQEKNNRKNGGSRRGTRGRWGAPPPPTLIYLTSTQIGHRSKARQVLSAQNEMYTNKAFSGRFKESCALFLLGVCLSSLPNVCWKI
jgi:hypothetical protein